MPAISKHLKGLNRAGHVTRGRQVQRHPCRLQAAPLKVVADWLQQYARFFTQRLDRLDGYLQKLEKEKKDVRKPKR